MIKNNDNQKTFKQKRQDELILKKQRTYNVLSNKNSWFYFSIILISVLSLALSWVIESNTYGVVNNIIYGFNFDYLYLIFVLLFLILLFNSVSDYICLYSMNKQRKFWGFVGANIVFNYYGLVTSNTNKKAVFSEYLVVNNVNEDVSREITNGKDVSLKIAMLLYSLIVLVVGTIFAIRNTNITLYVIAIISFICLLVVVLSILYFDKYKDRYLIKVSNLCKFLYRLKIIKNVESIYNRIISWFIECNSALRANKGRLILKIVSDIFVMFFRHMLLFVILKAFNNADWSVLIEVLFKCTIVDLTLNIYPLPKGLFIYELIFLVLFRNVFFDGYVLYGLLMYRILDYFIYAIIYMVGYIVRLRKCIKKIKLNCK